MIILLIFIIIVEIFLIVVNIQLNFDNFKNKQYNIIDKVFIKINFSEILIKFEFN